MTPKELFDKNQKLVGWCMKQYIHSQINASEFDDIMQEGRLALWEAAQRYDVSRGTQFSTYAVRYIMGRMKRYVRELQTVIRIPRSAYTQNDADTINSLRNITSLDAPISISDDSTATLYELVGTTSDEYEYITEDLIESFLSTIENPWHRDIIEEYLYAKVWSTPPTQDALAEKYNTTQPSIARIIRNYKKQFRLFVSNNEDAYK